MTLQDYKLNKIIGFGAFGKILLATNKEDKKLYAVKLLNKNRVTRMNMLDHVQNEYNLSVSVQHRNIVKFKEFIQTAGMLCYVMEFNAGGTLGGNLKKRKFTEKEATSIAAQLVLALDYLHSQNIIYRDLKADNVMFDTDGNVKLIDFGLSKKTTKRTKTFCGTADYLSPEIVEGTSYGSEVDWWALGVITYQMLTGTTPFYAEDKYEMFDNIKNGNLSLSKDGLSDATVAFITELLTENAEKRLKTPDAIKKHAFFKDIDWKALAEGKLKSSFDPKAVKVDVSDLELTKKELDDTIAPKWVDDDDYYKLSKLPAPFKNFESKKFF